MLALLLGLALAQDVPPIRYIPEGETVTLTPVIGSYLLPGPKYDRCLLAAREVQILDRALVDAGARCRQSLSDASLGLQAALTRQETDAAQNGRLEASNAVLSSELADMRRQRNQALGGAIVSLVVTGVVLGLLL